MTSELRCTLVTTLLAVMISSLRRQKASTRL